MEELKHIFHWQIDKKMERIPEDKADDINMNPCGRERSNCTIFLGFTSNMISAGIREMLRYLAEHNMVRYDLKIITFLKKIGDRWV